MNRTLQDDPGQTGPLGRFGPRMVRTKMFLLFGLLMLGYVGVTHLLYGRHGAIVGTSLTALALGVLFSYGLSREVVRPLVQMTRTAERIAEGDLKQRARVYGRDEAGLLARTFNGMVDSLESKCQGLEDRVRTLEEEADRKAAQTEKDAAERLRLEKELRLARVEIDQSVDRRTEQLARANDELHGKVLETRRSEDHLQSTLDRMEDSLEGTFKAMAMTLELRDPYMAGHQTRVSGLAVAIARELNLPWEKIEGLRFAGLIHDIGKISAPAEIMAKPCRLTKSEFQLVKDHPRVGYDMIKDIASPWPVAHIILQHHERMDGSGYPDGLVGDAILVEARVLAVADVVEALCSLRPYRPALGLEKGLDEVRKGRGIRYDARVVDACVKVFRNGRFAFRNDHQTALYQ
jgi:HD-GYP domain-containing protein (c-di-GMP phosphodiesterase class II)